MESGTTRSSSGQFVAAPQAAERRIRASARIAAGAVVSVEVGDVRPGLRETSKQVQQRVGDKGWQLLGGNVLDAQLCLYLPRDGAAELFEHFGAGLVAHARSPRART